MKSMIDLHCDTILRLGKQDSLLSNSLSVDIPRMEANHFSTSCFALFVKADEVASPWKRVNELHDRFVVEMERSSKRIRQVRTTKEIEENPLCGAILTCEEGAVLEGKLERLDLLQEWGVRSFTFTWNFENELAYPNSTDKTVMQKGLKALGIEAVAELERHHIIADVSHLNDGGFLDVAKNSTKPFWASHSDARSLRDVPRNLSDDMLRLLSDKGGVTGLNFCPSFLSDDGKRQSRIEDMVRHVLHIRSVAGSSVLAVGTDFDGITGELEISDISQMDRLRDALVKAGLSQSELDGMWYGNALRVLSA